MELCDRHSWRMEGWPIPFHAALQVRHGAQSWRRVRRPLRPHRPNGARPLRYLLDAAHRQMVAGSCRRNPRRGAAHPRNRRSLVSSLIRRPASPRSYISRYMSRATAAMSEYQYYEFQAIDRPLTAADREALRNLSTRARITATSFTNSYEWGDFKGDPTKLMERWFDLHLYLANWGTRRLMIRLPKRLVDRRLLDRFLGEIDCAKVRVAGENLILDIWRDEVEFEDWDDGTGWLAALAPLRADVLAGDLRLFYLLWLTAFETDAVEADAAEPMPGIGSMTASLGAFADFFGIDPDLVQAAAERPADASANEISPDAV